MSGEPKFYKSKGSKQAQSTISMAIGSGDFQIPSDNVIVADKRS